MAAIAERHRGLSKRDRTLRQRRRKRFADQARRQQNRRHFAAEAEQHADSPGCILADPDYHMAKACGIDVTRRELRVPDPPTSPHFDPDHKSPVASTNCAAWRWWKALDREDQDDLYDLSMPSHGYADGESAGPVDLTSRLIEHVDPRSALEWGREPVLV